MEFNIRGIICGVSGGWAGQYFVEERNGGDTQAELCSPPRSEEVGILGANKLDESGNPMFC